MKFMIFGNDFFLQSLVDLCRSKRPQGYPPECLKCEVEIGNEEHNRCPFDSEYGQSYRKNHDFWRNVSNWNFVVQYVKFYFSD